MVPLIQILSLVAVVELFVQFMPRALRRASRQNKFRLDGTISENRVNRERRAHNRLRVDLVAVFVLVFLTGNALFYTIDSLFMPMSDVFHVWIFQEATTTPTQVDEHASTAWEAHGTTVIGLFMAWLAMSMLLVVAGVWRAYRSFASGVHERSAENFNLDMTRMSMSSSEFAEEVLAVKSKSGRTASAG